jgi:hypothetical protein
MSITAHNDYVRNPEGIWVNTKPFVQEGLNFLKNGYYCPDPKGSPAYLEYWGTQLERCVNGYSSGGVRITGHHYFYLNFCKIDVVQEISGKVAKKISKFPDFWDGDYNFFWCKHIARYGATEEEYKNLGLHVSIPIAYLGGGYHMIVGKSRRKGYSFKNAAICANNYNTIRDSTSLIGAYDSKYLYPEGTMGMASSYLSFLNDNTAWKKAREYVDKQEHKRASFKKMKDGVPVEAGYLSQIMAISFKDNPDAARGKDPMDVLFEEAGKFPNLIDSYMATYPGLTAGKYITGQIMIFGTGGDMEDGTKEFAQMFYNPMEYRLLPFVNIWDKESTNSSCGFFHPVTWNMEGYYDNNGNSDIEGATAEEEQMREEIRKNSSTSKTLQQRQQEYPFSPSEAFLLVSLNDFPTIELRNRLNMILRENLHLKKGQPVELYRCPIRKKVVADPILDITKCDPIWRREHTGKDFSGVPIIYEYPTGIPPKGAYKIGFDPYRQAQAHESPSLASIYVYKTVIKGHTTKNIIVAQYVGRPYDPDDVNKIAELFAELYNAEIMYENEVTHVKSYFEKKKKLHLLAVQPDAVISANINKSTVARVYGIHMVEKLKDAGEKYIKKWLLEVVDYDEDGHPITNIDLIYDPGLLEELILYNRKGNFDRVMSFMMLMFQLEEDGLEKEYNDDKKNQNVEDLLALMNNQFQNRNSQWN